MIRPDLSALRRSSGSTVPAAKQQAAAFAARRTRRAERFVKSLHSCQLRHFSLHRCPRASSEPAPTSDLKDGAVVSKGVGAGSLLPGQHPCGSDPPEKVLKLWRNASAVCFDIDDTLTQQDGLDLLAQFMGKKEVCGCVDGLITFQFDHMYTSEYTLQYFDVTVLLYTHLLTAWPTQPQQ